MPHCARHRSTSVPPVITPPPPARVYPEGFDIFFQLFGCLFPSSKTPIYLNYACREQKRVAVLVAVQRQKQSFYQERNAFLEFFERKKLRGVMHKYHTLFCSSQSLSAFPQISLGTASGASPLRLTSLITTYTKQIFYLLHPLPPRYKTILDNSPPPGTRGWTCRGDCSVGGGWGVRITYYVVTSRSFLYHFYFLFFRSAKCDLYSRAGQRSLNRRPRFATNVFLPR